MSEEKHACKDCTWIDSPTTAWSSDRTCVVPLDKKDFHPVKGYSVAVKGYCCVNQNYNGLCSYFKPSLLARFLRLFGRKY